MSGDNDIVKKYSVLPRPTLSQKEQNEIWNNIEQEMIQAKPQRFRRFHRIRIGPITAAIAIGIIGWGSLSYAGHYFPFQQMQGKKVLHSFAAPASISNISVRGNAAFPQTWIPIQGETTAHKLLTWLRDARVVHFFPPKQQTVIHFGGGATTLNVDFPSGRASMSVDDVDTVEVDEKNNITYLHSKPLAHWLSSGLWRTEFLPEESRSFNHKTYKVIAPQLSGYPVITPEGVAWFSRSSTTQQSIPHSGNTLPKTPYKLYLSRSNSTTLDVRSAKQLFTLPLYVTSSKGQKFYVSAYGLQSVGQWLLYAKRYYSTNSKGVATQTTPNELLVYNMKTNQKELVTKFTSSNKLSFWYGTYKQYVFFDKRLKGHGVEDHMFMYSLKTKHTTKLNISPKGIKSIFSENGISGDERVMHYKFNTKSLTVRLTKWQL